MSAALASYPASVSAVLQFQRFLGRVCRGFPVETHRGVGKETEETAHMERWNNTLRQRVARYVRKTLSFSKSARWHSRITKWFIITYNLNLSFTG
jgi:hypothetical protein